jgi:homoserine kinase
MAAALSMRLELEVEETGSFAVQTDLQVATGRENLCVRAFEQLHPADGFTFKIRSEIPLSGGLGSSAAAIVAGLMAADHLFELDADLLALASELEGHPDNVAASLLGGFVVCADGDAIRFDPPTGLEALAVVPRQPVHTRAARAALAERVPLQDAVFNVAHGALLTLGLARGDWDLLARGLHDRLHQRQRAHLFPRSFDLACRARELGALGATISGAGPTVLVWCFYEQTGAVADALAGEVDGWASVMRASFEPQGAYVGEL